MDAGEAVRRLRESEERYRTLFDVAPDAIVVHSAGIIRFVNPAAVELFGAASAEDLVDTPVIDRVHPDDRAAVLARVASVNQGGRVPLAEERLLRLDGTVIVGAIAAGSATFSGQSAVIAVVRDITARREAEEALRRNEEQLRQVQRLEAIGQLAGGAAHDFNNLLTVIRGHAAITLDMLDAEDPVRPEVEAIDAAARRASVLTQQLLAFGRRQRMQPRVVDPNEVLREVEIMARRLIGERVAFELVPSAGTETVRVDPDQLVQVLLNLVVNARDATPDGGTIRMDRALVRPEQEPPDRQASMTPGEYVRIRVIDNGTGIDEDTIAHIFEPFYTTKEPGAGTGLGLSTAYGIVKQSGGYIFVESVRGVGTTFSVYLPIAADAAETTLTAPEAAPARAETRPARILVVEDEESVRELARRILEGAGYEVLAAGDAASALRALAEARIPIDLLLTDVVMPGISGIELANRLSRMDARLPVLYMSGYPREEGGSGHALPESATLLQKPFTPDDLVDFVRAALDRASRS